MEKEQDLKTLVKKYLTYLLYWYHYEKYFDVSISEKYGDMIAKVETKMRRGGVTGEQIEKLIECAKQYQAMKEFEVTEGMLRFVKQRVFPEL